MFPKGFPMNPGELPILLSTREERRPPRETVGDRGRMEEQSYDPIVPVKVGNRRASERSGHGIMTLAEPAIGVHGAWELAARIKSAWRAGTSRTPPPP